MKISIGRGEVSAACSARSVEEAASVKVEDRRVVAEAQVEVQVKAAQGGTRRGGRTRRWRRRVEWFWTVWVMLGHLRRSRVGLGRPGPSSSFSLLPACEALARGELHNSWPCYTPSASLRRTLFQRAAAILPYLTTTFYASTSFLPLP